ncbi:MAG: winged helix-turn-helix transcriptional regulator, partial [Bacillus mycoides]
MLIPICIEIIKSFDFYPALTGELKRLVTGITQKMLTEQLKELEKDGLVSRKVYNQV